MLKATGQFVVVGLGSPAPTYFWKGTQLTEVQSLVAHADGSVTHILVKVADTSNYDAIYAEMAEAGIKIKK